MFILIGYVVNRNNMSYEEVGTDYTVRAGDCVAIGKVEEGAFDEECMLKFRLPNSLQGSDIQLVYEYSGGFSYDDDVINWTVPQ